MKPIMAIVFALGVAVAAPAASQAAPVQASPSPLLILVSGGCGPGWHRGEYSRCRPNR